MRSICAQTSGSVAGGVRSQMVCTRSPNCRFRSSTSTRLPCAASAWPRLAVRKVTPAPPLHDSSDISRAARRRRCVPAACSRRSASPSWPCSSGHASTSRMPLRSALISKSGSTASVIRMHGSSGCCCRIASMPCICAGPMLPCAITSMSASASWLAWDAMRAGASASASVWNEPHCVHSRVISDSRSVCSEAIRIVSMAASPVRCSVRMFSCRRGRRSRCSCFRATAWWRTAAPAASSESSAPASARSGR